MSVERTIHVVAFDVPFPPDYGGVIDIYYRCRLLKESGYKVILHCFEYGRGRTHDHSFIADEVYYYSRPKRLKDWLSREPFIVRTRRSKQLLERLLLDQHPILFEGQHTTAFLNHPALQERKKLVRLHNVEWKYYAGLAQRSRSWAERRYFRTESRKLKRHEAGLGAATVLACISLADTAYYSGRFSTVTYMPVAFEMSAEQKEQSADKPFYLFHGNLSVAENEEAALWLVSVFSSTDHSLTLAGKEPSEKLRFACQHASNITLISNPSSRQLEELMVSTTAHLVIGFQQSGIKLKLLHALITGKRCIATPEMVAGTGLEPWCTVVSNQVELEKALDLSALDAVQKEAQLAFIQANFAPAKTLDIIRKYFVD